MNRVERDMSSQGSTFGLFQGAIVLEGQVRKRTRDLEEALRENEKMTRALQNAKDRLEREKEAQRQLLRKLEEAHVQLLQSEKLASIGQLAAGVAHEINNPIGFINSNLGTLGDYVAALLKLIETYEAGEPLLHGDPALSARLEAVKKEADIAFVRDDVLSLIDESAEGTQRVRNIVLALRDFSRPGQMEWEIVDVHQGIDSTLNVVRNEVKKKARVNLEYGALPPVECVPSQLNQVVMNLLVNAAQAIAEYGDITIRTTRDGDRVAIAVTDTGAGMSAETCARVFDPFFTTKPVGTGTGLGLSVSYSIIERHQGCIDVQSVPGVGTTFTVRLPIRQTPATEGADPPPGS
ncbi:histidine kinase [Billgrantia azerbaijanica]|nr:histidine kinase [Halomonas azerbaijanica]